MANYSKSPEAEHLAGPIIAGHHPRLEQARMVYLLTDGTKSKAILANPTISGDITPSMRDALVAPLSRAGFDFKTAATSMSEAQKAQVERWRATEISDLNKARRDPQTSMTDAEYAAEQARIDQSYAVQMGTPAPTAEKPTGRATQNRARVLGKSAPTSAGADVKAVTTLLTGQKPGTYTLNDGSVWTVAEDGTIAQGK